jgi:hypothetical protein
MKPWFTSSADSRRHASVQETLRERENWRFSTDCAARPEVELNNLFKGWHV